MSRKKVRDPRRKQQRKRLRANCPKASICPSGIDCTGHDCPMKKFQWASAGTFVACAKS